MSVPSTRLRWWSRRLTKCKFKTILILTFADGIRSLMRQDPDIIAIGEIRDTETAEMAVQSIADWALGVIDLTCHRCTQFVNKAA